MVLRALPCSARLGPVAVVWVTHLPLPFVTVTGGSWQEVWSVWAVRLPYPEHLT